MSKIQIDTLVIETLIEATFARIEELEETERSDEDCEAMLKRYRAAISAAADADSASIHGDPEKIAVADASAEALSALCDD